MEWYKKFKVGQKVRVVKKVASWTYATQTEWVDNMNRTIDKVYEIIEIKAYGGYRLSTGEEQGYNYWYPVEALAGVKGEQLLFKFYK